MEIEVICGPMFSGKTEELIRRLRRAQIARQQVLVFKPAMDVRYEDHQLVSHSKQCIPSIAVDHVAHMKEFLHKSKQAPQVIGIDEVQFFDESLIAFIDELANQHIRVIVAGLDQDYLGQPFGIMPRLLALADLVTKQQAICMVCGAAASKSQRIHLEKKLSEEEQELVLLGADERYEARCRKCHVRGLDLPFLQKGCV